MSRFAHLLHNLAVAGGHNGKLMSLPNPQGLNASASPHGQLRWGGQMFNDAGSLVAWINAHGGHTNVAQFAQNHPLAFHQQNYQEAGPSGGGVAGLLGSLGQGQGGPPQFLPPPQGAPPPGISPTGGGQHQLPPPVHPPLLSLFAGHRRRHRNVGFMPPPAY